MTEFRNEPVDPVYLPAFEAVPLSPISPHFAAYRLLSQLSVWIPLALVAWLMPGGGDMPPGVQHGIALAIVAGGTALAALAWLEARRRAYGLRERDLIYRSGLLIQRTTVLPISRLQHVETVSGPLERHFGLVRLICFTAGGAGGDLNLQGLERHTAEQIRQYLLTQLADQGKATEDTEV